MPTVNRTFWDSVKIWAYYLVYRFLNKRTKGLKISRKKYFTLLLLMVGAVILKIILKAIDKFLCHKYDAKSLSTIDEFWLSDPRNTGLVNVVMEVGEFDFKTLSEYIRSNFTNKIGGAQCRIVQMFGRHYFKKMSSE